MVIAVFVLKLPDSLVCAVGDGRDGSRSHPRRKEFMSSSPSRAHFFLLVWCVADRFALLVFAIMLSVCVQGASSLLCAPMCYMLGPHKSGGCYLEDKGEMGRDGVRPSDAVKEVDEVSSRSSQVFRPSE